MILQPALVKAFFLRLPDLFLNCWAERASPTVDDEVMVSLLIFENLWRTCHRKISRGIIIGEGKMVAGLTATSLNSAMFLHGTTESPRRDLGDHGEAFVNAPLSPSSARHHIGERLEYSWIPPASNFRN